MTTHVTIYRSATARHPIARDTFATFEQWCDELESMVNEYPDCAPDAPREAQKEAMLAFAPHRLRDTCPACTSEHPCRGDQPHRLLANVEVVTMIVLDVDDLAPLESWDELVARAKACAKSGMVYESPSSVDDTPRVRVVLPSVEHAPANCRLARIGTAHALGLAPTCGVLGASDAAKLFFAGRLHGTRERRVWRW